MGTKGIVAVGTTTHWTGVYNASDSYVEGGLGEELKNMAKSMSLAEMAKLVEDNTQGFQSFPFAYPKDGTDAILSSDTASKRDWLFLEYIYVIDVDAGKIWWGHSYHKTGNDPNDYTAGPPKKWHVLYSAEKRKKK